MKRGVIFNLPFRGREEFQALISHPSLSVKRVRPQDFKGGADFIVLGGSGRTVDDLDYLRQNGGEQAIRSCLANGGKVLAICGGYQMLGQWIYDPELKQGDRPLTRGLAILPHSTIFGAQMMECHTTATLLVGAGAGSDCKGEEHRSGFSWTEENARGFQPMLSITKRTPIKPLPEPGNLVPGGEAVDGMVTDDRQIWATYVHLICDNEAFLCSFLASL